MRQIRNILLLFGVVFVFALWGGYVAAVESTDITGTWLGILKVPGTELRIVFKIIRNPDGSITSKMDSPDQGAKDIPVAQTVLKDGKLHLDLPAIKGMYDGIINDAGTEIAGEWKQGMSFPLILKRTKEIVEIRRPQDPKPPFPYEQEEVSYINENAGVKLAGTLTIPKTKGPFPAVILITGSGAQDRNETLLNHHPFWVIADSLTRRGIAVLRVDDRGVGGSTGSVDQSTSVDLAGDVLAGVKYLKSRKEINQKQIGLIGHSEGGLIAPMAAASSKDISFIVLLAGPGLRGDALIRKQSELIIKAGGGTNQEVAWQRNLLDQVFGIISPENDSTAIKTKLHDLAGRLFSEMSDTEKQAIGNNSANLETMLQTMITPWYRFFVNYDPVPTLKKVTCPVLALNGSKDLQVPAKENLAIIAKALKEGGNQDVTITELPDLNHLFQHCKTGSPTEYSQIEETLAQEVLKIMGDWIIKHI